MRGQGVGARTQRRKWIFTGHYIFLIFLFLKDIMYKIFKFNERYIYCKGSGGIYMYRTTNNRVICIKCIYVRLNN